MDSLSENLYSDRPYWRHLYNKSDLAKIYRDKRGKQFIIRDERTGERVNVFKKLFKTPKLLPSGRWKYLIPYWIRGLQHQVIRDYPETEERFYKLSELIKDRCTYLEHKLHTWTAMGYDKKDLPSELSTSSEAEWAKPFILKLYNVDPTKWERAMVDEFKKMSPKSLMSFLCLKD